MSFQEVNNNLIVSCLNPLDILVNVSKPPTWLGMSSTFGSFVLRAATTKNDLHTVFFANKSRETLDDIKRNWLETKQKRWYQHTRVDRKEENKQLEHILK